MNYYIELDDKKPRAKKIIKEIIIWVIIIVAAVVLAYIVVNFALEKTTVVGASMENTLKEQDEIIIQKIAYRRFSKAKRFDVVVFNQKGREHSYYNIKRIIGLPGETVQIINGIVYIDEKPLVEPIPVEQIVNGGLANDSITLDENEYFVLGDNRNNSEDSRFANIGNIVSDDIVGKAWIRLKPFDFVNQINRNHTLTQETKSPDSKDKED